MNNTKPFYGFNTKSNSHVNLNTPMPIPPRPDQFKYNLLLKQHQRNQRMYVQGINRVPNPPSLANNR